MKFITGVVTGVAIGAAGAVYYSVKSGRDLRGAYEDVRAEIDARNYDAIGARIERGFAEVQAQLEDRLSQVRAGATAALDDADDVVQDATAEAGSRLDEGDPDDLGVDAEPFADDATDAIDSVADAGSSVASDAADATRDLAGDSDPWNRERA